MKKLIPILMIVAMLLIYPVGIFSADHMSRTAADYSKDTGILDGGHIALQEFVPAYSRIRTLGLDIGKKGAQEGIITYHFYDSDLNEFYSVDIDIRDMKDGELTDIRVDLKLVPGSSYYVGVTSRDTNGPQPVLHYRSLSGNGPSENLNFYYDTDHIPDASANIRFTYEIPLSKPQVLFYWGTICLLGAIIYYAIPDKNKKIL